MKKIERGEKLREGKTKIIWEVLGDPNLVLIEQKDSITAGDGTRRDEIPGKGAACTITTINCFNCISDLPHHFIRLFDEKTVLAKRVTMIPLEIVVRRVAAGSYIQRHPAISLGTILEEAVIEFFLKDDADHDPQVIVDLPGKRVFFFNAHAPYMERLTRGAQPLANYPYLKHHEILMRLAGFTFATLEERWKRLGMTLVDLKIECGFNSQGKIVIADAITNDEWRLWPNGDPTRRLDKDNYRMRNPITPEGIAEITEKYALVAYLSSGLLASPSTWPSS